MRQDVHRVELGVAGLLLEAVVDGAEVAAVGEHVRGLLQAHGLGALLGGLEHGAHAADAGAHYDHVGVNGLGDVGDGGGAVAPGAGLGLGGLVGNGGGGQARDGGGSGNGGGAGDELPTVEFHGDPLVSCRDVARGGACRVGAARTAQAGGPRV